MFELVEGTIMGVPSYGIATKRICVKDISTQRSDIEALITLYNSNHLSEDHLLDAVYDWLCT